MIEAKDDEEARARLEEGPTDFVLPDLNMPGVSGYALLNGFTCRTLAYAGQGRNAKRERCGTEPIACPADLPRHPSMLNEACLELRAMREAGVRTDEVGDLRRPSQPDGKGCAPSPHTAMARERSAVARRSAARTQR